MISIFDIFKIGIGPSSSPHRRPHESRRRLFRRPQTIGLDAQTERIVIDIYGSLALTGRGHGTFDALPCSVWKAACRTTSPRRHPRPSRTHPARTHPPPQRTRNQLQPRQRPDIRGDQVLPKHPNGLNSTAYGKDGGKPKNKFTTPSAAALSLPIKSLTNKPSKRAKSPTLTPAAPNCSPTPHEPARHLRSRVGKRSCACRLQRRRNPLPRRPALPTLWKAASNADWRQTANCLAA